MSTQLTVLPNAQPLAPQTIGFDTSIFKIRPANLEIVQKMSRSTSSGAVPGHFFDKKTGSNLKTMDVVLAALPRLNRVLLPPGQLGGKPICKSNDGLFPVLDDDRLTPMNSACGTFTSTGSFKAKCDHADWSKWHKNGKRKEDKPGCRMQKEFVFVERDSLLPFKMQVHGTSLRPFDDAMEGVARNAQVLIAQNKQPEPYWFSMTLALSEVTNASGSYWVLSIQNIKKLPDDDITKFQQQFEKLMAFRNASDEDEDESINKEVVDGGPAAY